VADPTKLDFSDWFTVVVAGIISGLGGAMAWFNSSNNKLHARLDIMEADMRQWDEKHAAHATEIAVVQTCQENTAQQLEAISATTRDTNENLKELSQTVTQVLLAIQAKK
jgi:ABC-type Zn2+ transport system substrate-binding protein/surface adhesin